MKSQIIRNFEATATGELRDLLSAAGVERPELYRVSVYWDEMSSWSKEERARRLSELMGIPLDVFKPLEGG